MALENHHIIVAVRQLSDTLGVTEPFSAAPFTNLLRNGGDISGCVKAIADSLKLPIITYVSFIDGSNTSAGNNFTSTSVVKTDVHGKGEGGITAQVSIPANLPLYGTSAFKNVPIYIKVSKNCAKHPLSFVAVMAHELTHIVLHSIRSSYKDNEVYTDIATMLLGFSDIMRNGSHVQTRRTESVPGGTKIYTSTIDYGYLGDKMDFAYDSIKELLKPYHGRRTELEKIFKKNSKSIREMVVHIQTFNKYLEYLDKNTNRKIKSADGSRIVTFHNPVYQDYVKDFIKEHCDKIDQFENDIQNKTSHFTKHSRQQLDSLKEQGMYQESEIAKMMTAFKGDLNVLSRNVGFAKRIKHWLSARHPRLKFLS